jgi:hypothetical protein
MQYKVKHTVKVTFPLQRVVEISDATATALARHRGILSLQLLRQLSQKASCALVRPEIRRIHELKLEGSQALNSMSITNRSNKSQSNHLNRGTKNLANGKCANLMKP